MIFIKIIISNIKSIFYKLSMRINHNVHLDYNDVLIKPMNSKIYSRKDVNLIRKIYFPISKQTWEGIPIIAANMDTIGTYEVYKVLSEYKIITCFHKFYTVDDLEKMQLNPDYFMISTGINEKDLENLKNILDKIEVKFICVDVANGYMEKLIDFCKNLRELYPNKIIVAGNVVCENRTKELIKYGKVDIVKIGIGSGCFDSDTKILLSNGTYKNIIEVNAGDKVINKNGKSVEILNKIYKGKKNIIEIENNNFNTTTKVTPDHNYWIANLKDLSINTIKKSPVYKLLKKNTNNKFKWEEINNIDCNKQFNLLPKKINWDLPDNYILDLVEFKNKNNLYDDKFIYIDDEKYNRYIEFDENIGLIIGNYLNNLNNIKNIRSYINNFKIDEKLNSNEILIKNFLNSLDNIFPNKYYNKNINFITGLYKGLLNLSNNQFNESKHYYKISKNLLEVVYFCILSLGYNFKINKKNKMIINKVFNTDDYLIGKINKIYNKENNLVDVYDLEVDSECHSFIANHSIVHNSACLTRSQTGIGVPQLSAIDECSNKAHDLNSFIIGDGGITCSGDIAKGFGAGSDFIMIGGLFSGHDENPGEIIEVEEKKFKIFYGMSSKTSMEKNYGKMDNYRSSEGRSCKVPYKGKLEDTVNDLLGGIRSTCTYVGSSTINDLKNRCSFIKVNNQLNKMYEKYDN